MDGRGRCLDNVFIERLWRSLKYEAVYLRELKDGFEAQRVLAQWLEFYNEVRPHSALAGRTPDEVVPRRWGACRAGGVVAAERQMPRPSPSTPGSWPGNMERGLIHISTGRDTPRPRTPTPPLPPPV